MKKIFFLILAMTLSIAVLMNEAAAQGKKAPKIRIGEFTGTAGETVDKTESDSPKGLTDSDVEFMYRAGLLDEKLPFFRQRFSVGYNLFYIKESRHLIHDDGGALVENGRKSHYSNGIAIQYHFGASFTRDYDWLGNPLLGVNLLLDGSFGTGGGDIMSLGIGGEVHFLWIFKIAYGFVYAESENKMFTPNKDPVDFSYMGSGMLPVHDKKSARLDFVQVGISIPVSKEFDVFALVSLIEERVNDWYYGNDLASSQILSCRAGISWKIF